MNVHTNSFLNFADLSIRGRIQLEIPSISSIFDKYSMLQQTQSWPNHTSYINLYVNEFVANVLRDNIGPKKISLHPQKKIEAVF